MNKIKTLEQLQDGLVEVLYPILSNLPERDVFIVIDVIKESMETYCRLVESGAIKKEQRYKQNRTAAIDLANNLLSNSEL